MRCGPSTLGRVSRDVLHGESGFFVVGNEGEGEACYWLNTVDDDIDFLFVTFFGIEWINDDLSNFGDISVTTLSAKGLSTFGKNERWGSEWNRSR